MFKPLTIMLKPLRELVLFGPVWQFYSMVLLRLIFLAFLMIPSFSAFAQNGPELRITQKQDFYRVVFDWNESVTYDIADLGGNTSRIRFDRGVSGFSGLSAIGAGSELALSASSIVSEQPLTVSFSRQAGVELKHFAIGDRVILDFYYPSGVKANIKEPVRNNAAVEPPKPAPTQPKPAQAKPKVPERAPPAKEVSASSAPDPSSLKPVLEENPQEALKDEEIRAQSSSLDKILEQAQAMNAAEAVAAAKGAEQQPVSPHLITITSTKSIATAVFEQDGALYVVVDDPDLFIRPQVSGRDSDYFLPLREKALPMGKVYITRPMPGTEVYGQGGALLTNIKIDEVGPSTEPVVPRRMDVDEEGAFRSGTVFWAFDAPGAIIDMEDPKTGQRLKIVTTEDATEYGGLARQFIDFDVLESKIGLVIRPKVDDLEVKKVEGGIQVSRPAGLAITQESKIMASLADMEKKYQQEVEATEDAAGGAQSGRSSRNIFEFKQWEMGGVGALNDNANIMLSSLNDLTPGGRAEDLITLSKMYFANGQASEALGFLRFAAQELPELNNNPIFLAIRGAVRALAWKYEEAFSDLFIEPLKEFEEIDLWKSVVLAELGDWQQAAKFLPRRLSRLYDYPEYIRYRLALILAEVALRDGNVNAAEELLQMMETEKELQPFFQSGMAYLKGEEARQRGNLDDTKMYWEPLIAGQDDYHRAKAGLALTKLLIDKKEISYAEAIDRLEQLRYAWRGDELEAQINYWLGRTYFDHGQYMKGLRIMRDSATFAPDSTLAERVTSEMSDIFSEVFLSNKIDEMLPQDAVSLYEGFTELVPTGDRGNQVIEALAEHLVKSGLLDRAAGFLTLQLDARLSGVDALRTSIRLGAIRLMNKQPRQALENLQKAEKLIEELPDQDTPARRKEINLLKAKTFAELDRPDRALDLLLQMGYEPDVNKLRADIAWQAGYWDDAADALAEVITDENLSLTRPLKPHQATLVLHRAVALNLGGDRISLANMREKFTELMSQTDKSSVFEVVTRPRQNAGLADRETLLSIVSEVDLFGSFLEKYKNKQE